MATMMGFLGLVLKAHRNQASLTTGSMINIWALLYQLSVETVCYSLVAELSSRRLQIKPITLGRNLYNIVGIICNLLTPYMLNPSAWNWGNYTGFLWGNICFFCIIYTNFRVPEPRRRSFAGHDLLSERGVRRQKVRLYPG
jgi:SP family general alpha glucoside:H+ symporter-like MFS transporter